MTRFDAPTPGQTVGPFFGYALPYDGGDRLVPLGHPGAIRLHGIVYDGAGVAIPDALIEIWQADDKGSIVAEPGSLRRDGYTFTGWGRAATDNTGRYSFTTLLPATDRLGSSRLLRDDGVRARAPGPPLHPGLRASRPRSTRR